MTDSPTKTKAGTDDPFIANPERIVEIAQRAFGQAKDAALAENKRRGVRSYGTVSDPRPVRRPARTKPDAHVK